MRQPITFIAILSILLSLNSCIGIDLIFDKIDPTIRWISCVDTLGVQDEFQLEVDYFNNVGEKEIADFDWKSSDTSIASVNSNGLIFGKRFGEIEINATTFQNDTLLTISKLIIIDSLTIVPISESKSGQVNTTSSYLLKGSFTLDEIANQELKLSFGSDYEASTALPGLYVYLSNNASTISNAYEIGEVLQFSGSHSYTIPSSIGINDYQYVLYFCKPFNVKVGHGVIN